MIVCSRTFIYPVSPRSSLLTCWGLLKLHHAKKTRKPLPTVNILLSGSLRASWTWELWVHMLAGPLQAAAPTQPPAKGPYLQLVLQPPFPLPLLSHRSQHLSVAFHKCIELVKLKVRSGMLPNRKRVIGISRIPSLFPFFVTACG
ncbi:hypothetical protein PCASD_24493 [Puccinia coronata f. sp. avenae]|uniref:Uncharacterized protein n=1 Tax=Puccinia coronata f. sp. avenae TaxID=200324 RepID=A0A2N5TQL1_9BASI|nr:hypothetical protein PCASD_24493 [Puccinia coronata f. sp. avenae]